MLFCLRQRGPAYAFPPHSADAGREAKIGNCAGVLVLTKSAKGTKEVWVRPGLAVFFLPKTKSSARKFAAAALATASLSPRDSTDWLRCKDCCAASSSHMPANYSAPTGRLFSSTTFGVSRRAFFSLLAFDSRLASYTDSFVHCPLTQVRNSATMTSTAGSRGAK